MDCLTRSRGPCNRGITRNHVNHASRGSHAITCTRQAENHTQSSVPGKRGSTSNGAVRTERVVAAVKAVGGGGRGEHGGAAEQGPLSARPVPPFRGGRRVKAHQRADGACGGPQRVKFMAPLSDPYSGSHPLPRVHSKADSVSSTRLERRRAKLQRQHRKEKKRK